MTHWINFPIVDCHQLNQDIIIAYISSIEPHTTKWNIWIIVFFDEYESAWFYFRFFNSLYTFLSPNLGEWILLNTFLKSFIKFTPAFKLGHHCVTFQMHIFLLGFFLKSFLIASWILTIFLKFHNFTTYNLLRSLESIIIYIRGSIWLAVFLGHTYFY